MDELGSVPPSPYAWDPLAMELDASPLLGGLPSLTAVFVIVTGILLAIVGAGTTLKNAVSH